MFSIFRENSIKSVKIKSFNVKIKCFIFIYCKVDHICGGLIFAKVSICWRNAKCCWIILHILSMLIDFLYYCPRANFWRRKYVQICYQRKLDPARIEHWTVLNIYSRCPKYPSLPTYCRSVTIPGQCCPSVTCDVPGFNGTYTPTPQLVPHPAPTLAPGATPKPGTIHVVPVQGPNVTGGSSLPGGGYPVNPQQTGAIRSKCLFSWLYFLFIKQLTEQLLYLYHWTVMFFF